MRLSTELYHPFFACLTMRQRQNQQLNKYVQKRETPNIRQSSQERAMLLRVLSHEEYFTQAN